MNAVAPVVVAAQEEDALPGLAAFVRQVCGSIVTAHRQSAQARFRTWEVARSIYEYAARPDVAAYIYRMNHPAGGSKRPGRPFSAIALVKKICAKRELLSTRALERWLNEWTRVSRLLNLKPSCPASALNAAVKSELPIFVEGVLDQIRKRSPAEYLTPNATRWTEKNTRALRRSLLYEDGNPKPIPRRHLKSLAKHLHRLLKPHGLVVRRRKISANS